MYNMEHCWFISDLHFNHQYVNKQGVKRGVLLFERGNKFKTIQEHDDYIIETLWHWGAKHKEDTLFILGDFGDINKMRQLSDLLRYNCGINLIGVKGNHDAADNQYIYVLEQMFDTYYTMPQYIHPRIIVSHEPQYPTPDGVINIHGHLHASKLDSPQHINCSIHITDYRPIGWKTIQKAFSKVPKANYKFLREPYRNEYIFTQPKDDAVYDKNGKIKLKESIALYNKKYGKHIQ